MRRSPPCTDTEFDVDGNPTGRSFETPWASAFNADIAWDPTHHLLWQVNVGGDNGIYGLDPSDGSVQHVITGTPWSNTSQRGLAYDPASDTFYIGGWNEGIVYRVSGLDSPTPGTTLGQCATDDPNISGLAWNASFGKLWVATNSDTDTIYLDRPADLRDRGLRSAIPRVAASTAPVSTWMPPATCGRSARTAAPPTSSTRGCPTSRTPPG